VVPLFYQQTRSLRISRAKPHSQRSRQQLAFPVRRPGRGADGAATMTGRARPSGAGVKPAGIRYDQDRRGRDRHERDRDREPLDLLHGRDRRYRSDQLKFLTIAQVAERVQVASRTVRRWIMRGDLTAHRIGNVVRIAEIDLRCFLALHREI
jgi:excisionase family DNA binding protein